MKNYIFLKNYNQTGSLGVSSNVFSSIGEHSLEQLNIDGVDKNTSLKVSIKDNRVIYRVNLLVKDTKIAEVFEENFKTTLKANLMSLCDVSSFIVNVKTNIIK